MAEEDSAQDQGCSYGMISAVALAITLISAGLTFLFANEMYHGTETIIVPSESNAPKIDWIPAKTTPPPVHRPPMKRKFSLARISAQPDVCFLIPAKFDQENVALRVKRTARTSNFGESVGICGVTIELQEQKFEVRRDRRNIGCSPIVLKCENNQIHASSRANPSSQICANRRQQVEVVIQRFTPLTNL